MTDDTESSLNSLLDANRSRAKFSSHGSALGAAGYIDPDDKRNSADFLGRRSDTQSISPPAGGFGKIMLAAAWDNRPVQPKGMVGKLFGKIKKANIDLDLGCLYELQDGRRGAVQAFGNLYGNYNDAPWLQLSGDERTGDAHGDDEWIKINGAGWPSIKRILAYIYIYDGAHDWQGCRPQVQVRVADHKPLVITPSTHHRHLSLCVIASLENVRDGIRITNHTEYFAGHAEMDRAFGFGLEWDTGQKPAPNRRKTDKDL